MDNRYHRHNRRKYSLKVHIVLVTKYRKQLLRGNIDDAVKQKIQSIADAHRYEIVAMETGKDHVHSLSFPAFCRPHLRLFCQLLIS